MRTVIERLRLKNFESYRKADIDFTPGLNLITGRNSVGKSTLLDSILFALYGDVPDVEKKLLISRLPGGNEMGVHLKFLAPTSGSVVEVARLGQLSHRGGFDTINRLLRVEERMVEVEGDEDLRKRVTAFLGLSFKRFLHLAYVRQGELTTILKPKREDMDTILGISVLRELREQMEAAKRRLEQHEGRDVNTVVELLEQNIPQLEKQVEDMKGDIITFEGEVAKLRQQVDLAEKPELLHLASLVSERDGLTQTQTELRAGINALLQTAGLSSQEGLEAAILKVGEAKAALEAEERALSQNVDALRNEWAKYSGAADHFRAELAQHRGLLEKGLNRCPTCGQPLTVEHLQGIISTEEDELARLEGEDERARRIYEGGSRGLEGLRGRLIQLTRDIGSLEDIKQRVQGKKEELASNHNHLEEVRKAIAEAVQQLGLPFSADDPRLGGRLTQLADPDLLREGKEELERKQSALEAKRREKQGVENALQETKSRVGTLRRRLERARFAEKITKRLEEAVEARRRMLLRELEYRALKIYNELTDQHVYASFEIDPDDYRTYVTRDGLSERIPAMRVGGGHQTLIALAIRLALLQSLRFNDLLILDEPTYGVDAQNLPQLLTHIGQAAKYVSQVILVTHHGLGEEDASNIINVYVGEDGSSRAEVAS